MIAGDDRIIHTGYITGEELTHVFSHPQITQILADLSASGGLEK